MALDGAAYSPKEFQLAIKIDSTIGAQSDTSSMQLVNIDSIEMPNFNLTQVFEARSGSSGRVFDVADALTDEKGVTKEITFSGVFDTTIAPLLVQNCTALAESSDVVTSCCIPKDINTRLGAIEDCLTASGSRFYNKMLTGLSDTCSTMDAWKMVIILEILRKKGLPCVYNCSDQNTPDLQNATCEGVWKNQGSNIWYSTNTYQVGHVVKSPVNNQYYVAVNGINLDLAPNTTVSNTDNPISGWTRCCDESTYSSNINYLTKFLSFVEKYCKDCEIPPYTQDTSIIPTEVESEFTIGGISIENNGSTFGDS